jgi:hypothetical protein
VLDVCEDGTESRELIADLRDDGVDEIFDDAP